MLRTFRYRYLTTIAIGLFDPVKDRAQLAQELYQKSFGQFINFCVERLQLDQDDMP